MTLIFWITLVCLFLLSLWHTLTSPQIKNFFRSMFFGLILFVLLSYFLAYYLKLEDAGSFVNPVTHTQEWTSDLIDEIGDYIRFFRPKNR